MQSIPDEPHRIILISSRNTNIYPTYHKKIQSITDEPHANPTWFKKKHIRTPQEHTYPRWYTKVLFYYNAQFHDSKSLAGRSFSIHSAQIPKLLLTFYTYFNTYYIIHVSLIQEDTPENTLLITRTTLSIMHSIPDEPHWIILDSKRHTREHPTYH